jgi:hypothetical protein
MLKIKKNGQKVWVTFTFVPNEMVDSVIILGEWNNWTEEPMKLKKSGEYYITKVLSAGNNFQFGYKVNGTQWVNDDESPTVTSPFGSHNSLLEI